MWMVADTDVIQRHCLSGLCLRRAQEHRQGSRGSGQHAVSGEALDTAVVKVLPRPRFLPSSSHRGSCLKTLFGSKEAFYWTEVQHHQPPKRPVRIVSQSTKTCHQETNVEASSDGLDCRAEIRGSARRYETDLPCLGKRPHSTNNFFVAEGLRQPWNA
jgi:hypothetical protein